MTDATIYGALPESAPVLTNIRAHYNRMTQVQKRIADFILENPEFVVKNSISDLAAATDIKSEASIVRFYRTLGYDGYKDFKIQIAQDLAGQVFYRSGEDIKMDDSVAEIKRKVFGGVISHATDCMHLEDSELYEAASQMILDAKRIIVMGYGAAGGIAMYCQFRLTELGLTAMYNSDHHMVTPILAQPNPGDLIIAISKSGETLDVLQPLQNMPVGVAKIMAITSNENSPLAKMSDLVLPTHTDDVNLVTDSMNTRAIQMLIVDTLFSIVSIKGGKAAHDRLLKTRKAFYDARVPGSTQRGRTRG